LTAAIAHENNNPLAFVINNMAVLQRDIDRLLKILSLHEKIDQGLPAEKPELTSELACLKEEADPGYLQASLPRILDSTYKGLTRIAQIVDKLRDFARLDRAEVGESDVNESIAERSPLAGAGIGRSPA
jgi:two-component system, NtrC family, sensor kinase